MKYIKTLYFSLIIMLTWGNNTPPPCPSLTMSGSNVSCFGQSNGSALVSILGGSGNYTISWSNGNNTSSNFGLGIGTYTVNVIDNVSGCSVNGAYVVSAPNPISNSGTVTQVNCFGSSTGGVSISPLGGTAPYTYVWTNALGNTVSTQQNLTNAPAGSFSVQITDNNGCNFTNSYQITQPNQMLNNAAVITNVSCYGGTNGSVDLQAWGGTAPYTYLWNTGSSNQDVNNLTVGNYSVTITDNKGCVKSSNYTIIQPSVISTQMNATAVSCFGFSNGIAGSTVTGGTPPYAYAWQNTSTVFAQNNATLANIPASTYTVNITDFNGCSASNSIAVTQPSIVSSSLTYNNVSCHGGNDGNINLSVSGGNAPYTYLWVNAANQNIAISQNLQQIPADTFTVTISDANGCVSSMNQIITEPEYPLSSTTNITNVLCFGNSTGAISVSAAGGTAPYSYNWLSGQNTAAISNLNAGNYSVTMTDALGCVLTNNVNVTQPNAALNITNSITDVTCFGFTNGAINTAVTGGTLPYTFNWSNSTYILAYNTEDLTNIPAETYVMVVLDQHGCTISDTFVVSQPTILTNTLIGLNILCHGDSTGSINLNASGATAPYSYAWNNGITSEDQAAIPAGFYSVLITDANGCSKTDSIVLTEPQFPITYSFTTSDVTCRDGSNGIVNLTVTGGTPLYSYAWTNASTNALNDSLTAGIYGFLVTDANGCTVTDSMTIFQPDALSINEVITPVTCYGLSDGTIDLTTLGGTAPYQFTWFNSTFALSAQTEDLIDFPTDTYQVEIIDSNGCFYEYFVILPEPDSLNITSTEVVVTCHGGTDGSIDITVTGGNPGYTYTWSNGEITEDISNLAAGSYQVTVSDTKNCTDSLALTIIEPAPVTGNTTSTAVTCIDQSDGTAFVEASGGVGAYTFNWSNGTTDALNEDLASAMYSVLITDALGCTATDSIWVPINPIACIDPVNCFTPNNDQINDTWVIDNMELYPDLSLSIFNKWGNLVFEQRGNYTPWDGSYNARDLPAGTYYYIINLNYLDRAPITGTINILK
jgi:gliding motility-associated-like protein